MIIKQIEVRSLFFSQLSLAVDFSQIDSLRLSAYILKLLYENFGDGQTSAFKENFENNETIFSVSSPYFLVNGKYFFPVIKGFEVFLEKEFKLNLKEEHEKKLKEAKYFPILDFIENKNLEEILKNLENIEFEKRMFRIRNVINRLSSISQNVYVIKFNLVRPFRFLIAISEKDKEKFNFLNEKLITIGKRISIGFGIGIARIEQDVTNKIKERIELKKAEKNKSYILLNRIPIFKDFSDVIDWDNSYYEIVKITGYTPKMYKRVLFCIKEGSIIKFKENYELKNYVYELNNDYLIPIRPMLLRYDSN